MLDGIKEFVYSFVTNFKYSCTQKVRQITYVEFPMILQLESPPSVKFDSQEVHIRSLKVKKLGNQTKSIQQYHKLNIYQ